MEIAIGSDHAGFEYKERLKLFLIQLGHIVEDFGTDSDESVDYPDVIRPLALAVAGGQFERGIILGGSGNGEAIVANRITGIRCSICWNMKSARLARQHNDANILSLGQRLLDFGHVQEIVECWLKTEFDGGRHLQRIGLIDRPTASSSENNGHSEIPLPHRTEFVEEANCICDSCGEEFQFPLDISGGGRQEIIEECPVCDHENAIVVELDEDGTVSVISHSPETD